MRKTIKPLKKHFKRLEFKNSELRTPNSDTPSLPLPPRGGGWGWGGGFTLIEVIILIVMAGILLPVIIVPFATGIRGSQKPEMATKAMYLGHQRMEELMKYRYHNSALDPTALTPYADITGFSGYQWQWEIYYVDDNFNVVGDGILSTNHRGYKRICVRVKDPMNDTYEIYSVVAFFH